MRRATLPAVAVAVAVAVAAAGLAGSAATADAAAPTGRLLVTLEPAPGGAPVGRAAAAGLVSGADARLAGSQVPQLGLVTVRPEAGGSLRGLARDLRARPGVARVEVERRAELRAIPDDPALTFAEPAAGAPRGTPVQWWAQRHGLFRAWDVPQALDATVAIIDTGVDATHPEFAGRIAGGVDEDKTRGRGPATVDETGHGTHVASLACAAADNAIGIAGTGFGCKLLIVKSDLSDSSVAASIVRATDRGADAINMSFGTDGGEHAPAVMRDAVRYAYERDVILVSAAADDPIKEQGHPSNLLQPTGTGADLGQGLGLSVTAANFADQKASFAGFGSQISLAAYGAWNVGANGPRGLLGALPAAAGALDTGSVDQSSDACDCRTTFQGDTRWAYVQGTSMASPIVAATAAMVRRLNPDLKAAEVIRLLKETARRPVGAGWGPDLGWGILQAGNAVAAAQGIDRRPPALRLRVAPARSRTLTLRIVGGDRAPGGVRASGLAHADVWRSLDGRPARLVARTTKRSLRLQIARGPRYAFWAVGTDAAGNRERRPLRPDAHVRLAPLR